MSLMRAAATGGSLKLMLHIAMARSSASIASTPKKWEVAGFEVSKNKGAPKIHPPWNKWFPHEPIPLSPHLEPYKEEVKAGQTYYQCACGDSSSQPCAWDGSQIILSTVMI